MMTCIDLMNVITCEFLLEIIRGQNLRTIGPAMYLHTSTVVLQDQKERLKIE